MTVSTPYLKPVGAPIPRWSVQYWGDSSVCAARWLCRNHILTPYVPLFPRGRSKTELTRMPLLLQKCAETISQ